MMGAVVTVVALGSMLLETRLMSAKAESSEVFTALSDMARIIQVETALQSAVNLHLNTTQARLAKLRKLREKLVYVRGDRLPSARDHGRDWWMEPISAFAAVMRLTRVQSNLRRHFERESKSSRLGVNSTITFLRPTSTEIPQHITRQGSCENGGVIARIHVYRRAWSTG